MSDQSASSFLQRIPLRVTLVVALVLLAAIGLTATGAVVTTQLRGYLVHQVDDDLAGAIPRSLIAGPDRDAPGDSPFGADRSEWLRVTTPQGVPVVDDTLIGPNAPPPRIPRERLLSSDASAFTVPATSGDGHWRVRVQRGVSDQVGQVLAVHAISLDDVEGTVARLVLLEVLVGLLVLLLLGGAGYLVVRTSLRPLEEVEQTAAQIAAGDLSRRVPESDPRTEVGRLSLAFNTMLGQIEAAFRAREASEASARASEERMRRFVADASHELRTPLTSIRGFAELHRQGAVTEPAELERMMRRVEDEASRMGLLVEDLLLLARLDQQRPLEQAPVDLLDVVTDAVEDARLLAPDRTVELVVHGDEAPIVLGDEPRLRQVVTNLVSNALTHTPAGTPVAVTLDTVAGNGVPGHVRVAVHDRGPGLSEEQRAKVFERFYRADPSRTRAAGGTGLGLSIVAALVAAHGGRVHVESEPGTGSTFAVDLLLHTGDEADSPADSPADGAVDSPAVPTAGG